MKRLNHTPWSERGSVGVETAATLPTLLLAIGLILTIALVGVTRIASVVAIAERAREVGGASSPTNNALSVTALGASFASSINGNVSPDCERAVRASLGTTVSYSAPFYQAISVYFGGASTSRIWEFQPGPAADMCP
jgi:hypothetical protein